MIREYNDGDLEYDERVNDLDPQIAFSGGQG